MAGLKRYNINNLKTDQQNVKENFVRDLRRTGKVVFCFLVHVCVKAS